MLSGHHRSPQGNLYEENSHDSGKYDGQVKCLKDVMCVFLQAAIEKVKEADKLVATSKITPGEKVTMGKRASTMSYALQGRHTQHY